MSKKAHHELKRLQETFPETFATMYAILELRKSDLFETRYLNDCIPIFFWPCSWELQEVYEEEKKRNEKNNQHSPWEQ